MIDNDAQHKWGLPDWRVPENYMFGEAVRANQMVGKKTQKPDPIKNTRLKEREKEYLKRKKDQQSNLAYWRWQFVRRRPSYREHYALQSRIAYEQKNEEWLHLKYLFDAGHIFEDPHFEAEQNTDIIDNFAFVFDPKQPDESLFFDKQKPLHPDDLEYYDDDNTGCPHGFPYLINPRWSDPPEELVNWGRADPVFFFSQGMQLPMLETHQVAAVFNLGRPLADQILLLKNFMHKARKDLEGMQQDEAKLRKNEGGKTVERLRFDKFNGYLRVLDARECGAVWTEVEALLPKSLGERTARTARDYVQLAKETRDKL